MAQYSLRPGLALAGLGVAYCRKQGDDALLVVADERINESLVVVNRSVYGTVGGAITARALGRFTMRDVFLPASMVAHAGPSPRPRRAPPSVGASATTDCSPRLAKLRKAVRGTERLRREAEAALRLENHAAEPAVGGGR